MWTMALSPGLHRSCVRISPVRQGLLIQSRSPLQSGLALEMAASASLALPSLARGMAEGGAEGRILSRGAGTLFSR